MGEEMNVDVDIEPVDFVLANMIDDINNIRDAISEDEEITNKETLDYLDKTLEIMSELYKDHKVLTTRVNQLALVSRNQSLLLVGDIEEEIEDKGGEFYS